MNLATDRSPPAARAGAFPPEPGGAGAPGAEDRAPFSLTRSFALLALVLIAASAAGGATLLSWFVSERMLEQEGVLTRDFVDSLVLVERPLLAYFADTEAVAPPAVEDSFEHIARIPDVLRANVYDRQRRLIWSSEPQLAGRQFGANEELERALAGEVVVEKKTRDERVRGKAEYEALRQPAELFVEIYVPVVEAASGRVLGAIEFYKNPRGLMRLLAQLQQFIVLGAIAITAVLFLALFGAVRRADRLLQAQHRRLVDAETFAVVGELSAAIAHGIRNPLAVIRSSAELIQDAGRGGPAIDGPARDIVEQTDRLGAWLRELLTVTAGAAGRPQTVALTPLVRDCLSELAPQFERRRVVTDARLADDLPPAQGDALAVGQVLRSLLTNALEAVPEGGHVSVRAALGPQPGWLCLEVRDDGPGMPSGQRQRAGHPLFTTKPHGLGVGLTLARRMLERQGARLRIDSTPGQGTVVTVALRSV